MYINYNFELIFIIYNELVKIEVNTVLIGIME